MKFQLSIVFVLVVFATLIDLNSGLTKREQILFAKKASGRSAGDICVSSSFFGEPFPCGVLNTIDNSACCGPAACCDFLISDVGLCTTDATLCT